MLFLGKLLIHIIDVSFQNEVKIEKHEKMITNNFYTSETIFFHDKSTKHTVVTYKDISKEGYLDRQYYQTISTACSSNPHGQ